jgi:hypothetical protein
MGYTHYWNSASISKDNFSKITSGVLQIVATAQNAGINLEATFEANEFVINGVGEDSHESFCMNTTDESFAFCKTAFKPYDAVVTASLIYAKAILGDEIKIKSDGNWVDWQDGSILYEEVFGVEPVSVLSQ